MTTSPVPAGLPEPSNGNSREPVGQPQGDVTAHHVPGAAAAIPQGAQGEATTATPEPPPEQLAANNTTSQTTPSTPGLLPPFDWEDFQYRYEKALADADKEESARLKEFERLSKYFNVWASSASAHDNERALKRLQTRERYVSLSEESMRQKQKHYDEVMRAFQSALALLSSK